MLVLTMGFISRCAVVINGSIPQSLISCFYILCNADTKQSLTFAFY